MYVQKLHDQNKLKQTKMESLTKLCFKLERDSHAEKLLVPQLPILHAQHKKHLTSFSLQCFGTKFLLEISKLIIYFPAMLSQADLTSGLISSISSSY